MICNGFLFSVSKQLQILKTCLKIRAEFLLFNHFVLYRLSAIGFLSQRNGFR